MIFPKLVFGQFLHRDNRFRATVDVNGQKAWAHVPNSGRLSDLFIPGTPVWLAPMDNPNRKTAFDLKLVEHGPVLVSVDARLPNPLLEEALIAGKLPDFDYSNIAFGFSPDQEADPGFAAALILAFRAGVQVRAFTCQVTLETICIAGEIPVEIS
jgi:DNA-binding sugar fermentation-stimulating protein